MIKKSITKDDILSAFYQESEASKENLNFETNEGKQNLTASTKFLVDRSKEYFKALKEDGTLTFDEEHLESVIKELDISYDIGLEDKEHQAALDELRHVLFDYDVISPLIGNPDINDIIIRSYNDISVQKGRSNIKTEFSFQNPQKYESFVENLLKKVSKSCTLSTPVVDAAIEPHIRACVTHASFSPLGQGPMLTLRISRHSQSSIKDLINHELAPQVLMDYLKHVVSICSETILIAGEVGTGKTTLVKALASEIANDEAILIIEDTHEIQLKRNFVRTLLTREANTEGAGRIEPAQAIRTGMRMAMNRIILGEMRDAAAAEAFIDVCSSGHPGMSTIHARSAKDAVSRLELLLSRAQHNVNIDTIRKQISNAISVVVFLQVEKKNKKRRIAEVLEVHHSSDGAVQLAPLFKFNFKSELPSWQTQCGISKFQPSLNSAGIVLPKPNTAIDISAEQIYSKMNKNGVH